MIFTYATGYNLFWPYLLKSLDPNVIQVNWLQMANANLDITETSKRKTFS